MPPRQHLFHHQRVSASVSPNQSLSQNLLQQHRRLILLAARAVSLVVARVHVALVLPRRPPRSWTLRWLITLITVLPLQPLTLVLLQPTVLPQLLAVMLVWMTRSWFVPFIKITRLRNTNILLVKWSRLSMRSLLLPTE